jgi:hypothetical protein
VQKDQAQLDAFSKRISQVLGAEKLQAVSRRQEAFLNQAFDRLMKRKPLDQITDEEILGQYEMIVDHVSPLAYEVFRQK